MHETAKCHYYRTDPYDSARLALADVARQMAMGGSATPGSADANLFDLVRHSNSPGGDAWRDLDALTYAVASGRTGENALITWSALIDGSDGLSAGGN